jgi:adenylate kinase
MKLILLGPQGSGKGTQGKIIYKKFKIPHISTGEILRSAKGELKNKINFYINHGNLVPDELILKILEKRISQSNCKKGFILDGFPRNLQQAKDLENITKIDCIIEITLTDKEAVKRISARYFCPKCKRDYNTLVKKLTPKIQRICNDCRIEIKQRKDDYPKAIKKRLNIYHSETEPILEFYEDSKKTHILRINGEQEIKKVTKDILEKLKTLSQ